MIGQESDGRDRCLMSRWTDKKLREQRISRQRKRRTLARRERERIRRRHLAKSSRRTEKSQQLKGRTIATGYNLTFPAELDFADHLDKALDFFSDLRTLVDEVRPRAIRIDHSALQRISPAAALVLIAEVFRGVEVLDRCRWGGNAAANAEVHELLGEAGYWKYFKGIDWKKSSNKSRQYLQHKTGNRTSGQTVKEVIQHFLPELMVPEESKKVLYPALVECMDNVMKHAYHVRERDQPYYHRWWLLAYRDPATHELSFCFYDQGLGIPKTIRVRFQDRLGPLSAKDSELIAKAVVEGHFSSTRDPTRGRGLPTLKRFIDVARAGELMIVSHKSRCIFSRPLSENSDFDKRFNGTLIIWRLQN